MSEISTLSYLVNKFQSDLNSANTKIVGTQAGQLFTTKDDCKIEPSKRSIENVLNFARSYEVLETQKAGYVEMNLN